MAAAVGNLNQGRNARFAAACGALSQYVKAAEAERAAAATAARPVAVLPLMPGADVPAHEEEHEAEAAGPAPAAKLTICYGGQVVVLDDVPADRAAELLRLAAAPRAADLLPVARKASLQRFMEKRRGRAAAARAAPYSRPGADVAAEDAASSFPDHLKLAL
ncbi:unnamed protein product [Urochloa decumbens]|uniref:Protein TIFY n=1 Tax=Urochloa decumbens TaxID=240449 RepID=A0ABC8XY07_9POAL